MLRQLSTISTPGMNAAPSLSVSARAAKTRQMSIKLTR
jgi:hypothetical protein